MKYIQHFFRLINISYVLLKHKRKNLPRGQRLRQSLEELGPIFVKFGQILSTRIDIIPKDITQELVLLQDQVSPFPGEQAQAMVAKALNQPIAAVFKEFNITPLASASIAQVHAATLIDGRDVVVKVLRPNIHKIIKRDIKLLQSIAGLLEKCLPTIRRFKPQAIVAEMHKTIIDELDLLREAANCSQLRRNFANSDLLYIPQVYWEATKNNILVMERIYGTPISNIKELKKKKVNLKRLAEKAIEIFFTQVFRDCFFHADMHPGNLLVDTSNPDNPKYIAVDFGIMGSLAPEDQRYLAENFLAFFKRDYRKVAQLHIGSGWVPADTRVDEFESAVRCVCEPILERPLKDISFADTLMRLLQAAKRFNMNIQPQLILLQKTLISIESLSRALYPELDIWNTSQPFLEKWMRKQACQNVSNWLERLPEILQLLYKSLQMR